MTWIGCSPNTRLGMALLAPAALFAPVLAAQEAPSDEVLGETPERYAQVRVLEGEASIWKGELQEALGRGVPVAEGDVVESRGRGVLQLADGTRLSFGPDTRFEISVLFADREEGRMVILRLDRGRLRIDMGSQDGVTLRVDCPAGSLRLPDRSGATLIAQGQGEAQARVQKGRALFVNGQGRARLVAGDQLTVLGATDGLDRIRAFNTYDEDAFDRWAAALARQTGGESRTRVPQEIRHYADDLDGNGEWIRVEEVDQWVWRPRVTQPEWRPYWVGRWGCHPGGMTWISDEPWGFVTHHFGRWGWHARFGWYWVPGVYYSPAWVGWQSNDVYFGWAPLGVYNQPVAWGYGPWAGGGCWNILNYSHLHQRHAHRWMVSEGRAIAHFTGNGLGTRGAWRRGPLFFSPHEWKTPHEIRRPLNDEALQQSRLREYDLRNRQLSGRITVRRGATTPNGPGLFEGPQDRRPLDPLGSPRGGRNLPPPVGSGSGHRPADRVMESRPQPIPEGGVVPRERPHETRPRPVEEGNSPRERIHEARPMPREERPAEPKRPRETAFAPRPRATEERRPDPPPARERAPEPRPQPREERRPDPPPQPRPAANPEGRADTPSKPRQERRQN